MCCTPDCENECPLMEYVEMAAATTAIHGVPEPHECFMPSAGGPFKLMSPVDPRQRASFVVGVEYLLGLFGGHVTLSHIEHRPVRAVLT